MITQFLILVNIVFAAFLAGLVGLERGQKNKPTGMRTHMIVGSAAALLISLGKSLASAFDGGKLEDAVRTDPIRIIEAIIVGISFIGGGAILKMPNEAKVANLSSAASLLLSAGIGISVALHFYILSVGVTILILLMNIVLGKLEVILYKKKFNKNYNNEEFQKPDDKIEHE
jgi:putative Mg2+ transporter-C (MgtC) family protein